jgi:eukaryotic-like serine/threonine-protein kinase
MSTSDMHRTIGGRYRLDRSIGQGGMGTVWQGHDELLGREVAIKEVRFPPELGKQEIADLRERTLREARATARLSHPNVITTYDVVEEDDRPWIVMELLKTHSLSEVLRDDGPLPPHRVAEIGLGVLAALETAHAQGVVHRDVKPSNVLVTADGRPVLTDFGIATMAGDPALTSTGVVLGSPAYMSPERARGKAFGPESDLWSLGVTLFAAAEGRPPFESDNALGTLTAIISDPVPPMTVGGPLALAVGGLLRKDPQERASIATVRKQLQEAAADRTTEAAVPVVETVALDRAGRTEVLPAAGVGSAAPRPAAPTAPPVGTTTYGDEGRRRNELLVAALVVGLLLIGAIVAFALLSGGEGDNTADSKTTPSTSAPATKSSSPPATSTSAPPSDNGVPAGYQLYEDPSGFSLAFPDGWRAEQSSATAVDFKAPDGVSFLRVDQTDQPKDDAKKAWEEQEKSVKKDLPDYHRISIETVDYNGWDAADWEFTFGSDTHVLNRGFVPDDSHGYALYLSTPEDQWASSQDVFQTAADTFTPAG